MKKKHTKAPSFAVCISNEDYKASLEVGKLYRVIPDEEAASHGYIRVVDESGEDYGYAADRFSPLEIPQAFPSAEKHPRNYWFTTHWPPRVDADESGTGTGVWVPEGRQQAANDMRPGDYIAVYEARSGRAEIRTLSDGGETRVACKSGRGEMICYGTVGSRISAIPDSQPQKYTDGTEIWWRWHAGVTVCSRSGFVSRLDINKILGYKPAFNFHGFGDYHSGLKKITEAEFKALVQVFHASRPIKLPVNTRSGGHRYGGGEGSVHLNLKNYVAAKPDVALKESGLRLLGVEYEFPTNDRADIVLVDQHNRIVGVEIEPSVEGIDLVGPLQTIKYRYMLECFTDREPGDSRGMLIAHEISAQVKTVCAHYGVECYEISREVVDSWVARNAA